MVIFSGVEMTTRRVKFSVDSTLRQITVIISGEKIGNFNQLIKNSAGGKLAKSVIV